MGIRERVLGIKSLQERRDDLAWRKYGYSYASCCSLRRDTIDKLLKLEDQEGVGG